MERLDICILIVDDDKNICEMLSRLLQKEGFKTILANDGESALQIIHSESTDVILLDMKMPGLNGLEVLSRVKETDPDLPVIIITAYGEIRNAVQAIKTGAYDYLTKPFEHYAVLRAVQRALSETELKRKLKNLSSHIRKDGPLRELMGPSEAVDRLITMVKRVAQTDFSVVIQGETGSGKEVVAKAIHKFSLRSKGPFVPLDCGAIPETLVESEFFGYEKGAFTGAECKTPGKIASANGGTMFLDEVSNLPLVSQSKLLRAIQEKNVFPVGATKPLKIDVRLVIASNQDLYKLTKSGFFRSDLFFRLNEFNIKVPPLRERKEDIPYLAKRFLDITNAELNKNVRGFSESALDALLTFSWPGNVREFRSTIRRAVLMADDLITENHLDIQKRSPKPSWRISSEIENMVSEHVSFREIVSRSISEVERDVLTRTLQYTGGNKAKAARILKIDYKTIHTKVKQLGIKANGG